MKRCKVCGEVKSLDDFPAAKHASDGRRALCKPCYCLRVKAETARNREAINARRRAVYTARIEEMRERDRLRRLRQRDIIRERKRLAHLKNPEPMRTRALQWRREHLEEARRKAREYQKSNPGPQWARNATRRARVRNAPVVEKVDRQAIIERDRSLCGVCGQVVAPKDIHLDHIVPLYLGGTHTADNLRVTHRLCNLSRKRA